MPPPIWPIPIWMAKTMERALFETPSQDILSLNDTLTGLNGDFNSSAFDSRDTEAAITALRLAQGGSLSGGGSDLFVLDHSLFSSSSSGSHCFNFAGANKASQTEAKAEDDFYRFTLQTAGAIVNYRSLFCSCNQYKTEGKLEVSYTLDGYKTFVRRNLVPEQNNALVTFQTIDFADFTSSNDVVWTVYICAAGGNNYDIDVDVITLRGEILGNTPSSG